MFASKPWLCRLLAVAILGMTACSHTSAPPEAIAAVQPARPPVVYPAALRPGDLIAFVTPSRSVSEERVAASKAGLEAQGYRVKLGPNLTSDWGYLAGTDEVRAEAFMAAWADPEVKAVFCLTGGYGVMRILDRLDYDVIRANPKILIGFSDITGLHLAIHQRTGLVTYHAPMSPYALSNDAKARPFQGPPLWRVLARQSWDANPSPLVYGPQSGFSKPITTLAPGRTTGRLVGGNLSLIQSLMGTPDEIDTRDAILFIEDVNEAPYRVDRMLCQLRLAGKLATLRGVIVGQFTEDEPSKDGFKHAELFEQYFAPLGIPVLTNFPVGHVEENVTMPVGALVEMDADARTVTFLEAPVSLL